MRAVIQRVHSAKIIIDGATERNISKGLVVFLGIMEGDSEKQAEFLAEKIYGLRIFTDDAGKMNLSLGDICGDILIVSNFTLSADCKKGRRPSFDASAKPEEAKFLYDYFVSRMRGQRIKDIQTGEFGAHMDILADNDGPVTIIIDTKVIGK